MKDRKVPRSAHFLHKEMQMLSIPALQGRAYIDLNGCEPQLTFHEPFTPDTRAAQIIIRSIECSREYHVLTVVSQTQMNDLLRELPHFCSHGLVVTAGDILNPEQLQSLIAQLSKGGFFRHLKALAALEHFHDAVGADYQIPVRK